MQLQALRAPAQRVGEPIISLGAPSPKLSGGADFVYRLGSQSSPWERQSPKLSGGADFVYRLESQSSPWERQSPDWPSYKCQSVRPIPQGSLIRLTN